MEEDNFRLEHFFVSATIAALDGVNWFRLEWAYAHDPSLKSHAFRIFTSHVRIVAKLDTSNLLARKKGVTHRNLGLSVLVYGHFILGLTFKRWHRWGGGKRRNGMAG